VRSVHYAPVAFRKLLQYTYHLTPWFRQYERHAGAGDQEAGERALASLRFMGDAFFTTGEELETILGRKRAKV
jgi:hypothetical protein